MSNRTAAASRAVEEAWDRERELVKTGRGTRDWTPTQQKDILEYGKAYDEDGKAFEGHHMKSVEAHPEEQGNAGNIQLLTRREHTDAHGGSYRNPTNGYYDPSTGKTRNFGSGQVVSCEIINLSHPIAAAGGNGAQGGSTATKNSDNTKGTCSMGEGTGWQVTQEAVTAMKDMAAKLEEITEKIKTETDKMKSTFEENEDGLGAHSSDIRTVIEEVEETEKEAESPVKKLSVKLTRAADIRQKHLDNQPYNTGKGH